MGEKFLVQGGNKTKMTQMPMGKYTLSGELDGITLEEVRKIAKSLGLIDVNESQLFEGTKMEAKEHTDIVGSNTEKAVRIAAAHLKEIPDYYSRLKAMEGQAEQDAQNNVR